MKHWYLSKTIWASICIVLLGVLNGISENVQDPKILSYTVSVIGIVNIALRFLTSKPIE
jgi:Na+-driven multidrug efflux pump